MDIKLYQEELMDHFKNPRNYGRLDNPDFSAEDNNPSCGDRICIDGKLLKGYLVKINFVGKGCVLSQATASMLMELLTNKSIDYILSLTAKDVLNIVGLELGPVRIKCAMLPLLVLKAGINSITNKGIL